MKLNSAMAAALLAAFLAAPIALAEGEATDWAKLMEAKAESIVNIKFVLKIQISQGGQAMPEQERNQEVRGVLLDGTGLVLTANSHFDPTRMIMARVPPQYRDRVTVKANPSELKILFGNEEEEYETQIVARDSNLGLAFLQILELGDRETTSVDLEKGAGISIGQEIFGVTRMARGFDCVPRLGRAFASAKVEKPREMWAFNGDFGAIGLPVYDLAGAPVGILALQEASEGTEGGGMGTFILPLSAIARSLKAAKERAVQALEAAKAAEEEEATEETPEEETPKEETPKEDPPKEDTPKEDPPKEDPPKEDKPDDPEIDE